MNKVNFYIKVFILLALFLLVIYSSGILYIKYKDYKNEKHIKETCSDFNTIKNVIKNNEISTIHKCYVYDFYDYEYFKLLLEVEINK